MNIIKYEENFLGVVQNNLKGFYKNKKFVVDYKKKPRTEIGRLRDSIGTINKQIMALEQLKKQKEEQLNKALSII